jgi:hypothetical protein
LSWWKNWKWITLLRQKNKKFASRRKLQNKRNNWFRCLRIWM